MKKSIWIITAVLLCFTVVFCVLNSRNRERASFLEKHIDRVFTSNFSNLCTNLNCSADTQEKAARLDEENKKYAHAFYSVLSVSSYAQDEKLCSIARELYLMAENEELYEKLDAELRADLKKLGHLIYDRELINDVYSEMFE